MSFTILDARSDGDGDGVVIEAQVPYDAAAFRGHFPREPILPAVALLDAIARLADAHLDRCSEVLGVRGVRLRGTVAPDARLAVKLAPVADGVDFDVRTTDGPVARGRLLGILDGSGAGDPSLGEPTAAEADWRALDARTDAERERPDLPHEGPAYMLEHVARREAGLGVAFTRVPSANALVHADSAPSLVAIELAAQASAACGPAEGDEDGAAQAVAAGRGFVVNVRSATLARPRIAAGEPYRVEVRAEASAPPMRNFDATVSARDGATLARVRFATWVPVPE